MLLKFYGLLWYVSSISLTILYKTIGYLHLNLFITSSSFFLQTILVSCYLKKVPSFEYSKELVYVVLILSSFILVCNFSLQIISIHLLVISKSITPILTLIFTERKLKNLLPFIVIGIGLYLSNTKSELHDTLIEYLLMIIVTIITTLKFPILKKYFELFPDITTIQFLNQILFVMGIISFPFGMYQLYTVEITEPETLLIGFLLGTFLSLFISIGEYTIIHFNTIIDTVFIDIFKQVLLIVISGFTNSLELINWLGITLILTVILDFKLKNKIEPIELP